MKWCVICLGSDMQIRKEYFDTKEEAEYIATFIKEVYGNPMVKVKEVVADE